MYNQLYFETIYKRLYYLALYDLAKKKKSLSKNYAEGEVQSQKGEKSLSE